MTKSYNNFEDKFNLNNNSYSPNKKFSLIKLFVNVNIKDFNIK